MQNQFSFSSLFFIPPFLNEICFGDSGNRERKREQIYKVKKEKRKFKSNKIHNFFVDDTGSKKQIKRKKNGSGK